jgi:hypothetical protein
MAADTIPAAPLPTWKSAYPGASELGRRVEVILDHVRAARSWQTRLNRTLIRPEPLKHQAPPLIREVVTAAA